VYVLLLTVYVVSIAIPVSTSRQFEIQGNSKSKFIEVHLTTKEGDNFQSLNVWKVEAGGLKGVEIQVNVEANMNIQYGNNWAMIFYEVSLNGQKISSNIISPYNQQLVLAN